VLSGYNYAAYASMRLCDYTVKFTSSAREWYQSVPCRSHTVIIHDLLQKKSYPNETG